MVQAKIAVIPIRIDWHKCQCLHQSFGSDDYNKNDRMTNIKKASNKSRLLIKLIETTNYDFLSGLLATGVVSFLRSTFG